MRHLLADCDVNSDLVLRTDVTEGAVYLLSSKHGQVSRRIDVRALTRRGEANLLQELAAEEWNIGAASEVQLLYYHIEMLRLFENLVLGGNVCARSVLLRNAERFGVSLQQLLAITRAEVPMAMHAQCVRLLSVLYIDVDLDDQQAFQVPAAQAGGGRLPAPLRECCQALDL